MPIINSSVKRPLVEEGIVLSKFIAKERPEAEFNNRKYEAKPATPTVRIASSYEINENGLTDFVVLDYEVDEAMFKKLQFLTKVRVMYNHSTIVRDGKSIDIFNDRKILDILDGGRK